MNTVSTHRKGLGLVGAIISTFRSPALVILVTASIARAGGADGEAFPASAAKRVDRSVNWQSKSVVSGDFTCRGRQEFAILGTSSKEIVIAVFAKGKVKPLDVMRFSGTARDPQSAILTVEPLDFTTQEFERAVGAVPDGLIPSKTCLGLNMTDQLIDSAHIYWHRKNRRFESWSR